MGVHDFSDAIYSRGELEGDQCLRIPPESKQPIHDDTAQVDNFCDILDSMDSEELIECKKLLEKMLQGKEIPDPVEILEELLQEEPFQGAGTNEAVLEIFTFPLDIEVSRENFDDLVKSNKYIDRYFEPHSYSWDGWDFYKGDYEEQCLNYNEFSDMDMLIVWRVEENDDCTPYLLDKHTGLQVWIRNFSKHSYDYYVNAQKVSSNLTNFDLAYVAYLFGIDYRKKTRAEVFGRIKTKIADEFSFKSSAADIVAKEPKTIIKKLLKIITKTVAKQQVSAPKILTQKPVIILKTVIIPKMGTTTTIPNTKHQCTGYTKDGSQCKREIKTNETHCFQHKK